MGGLLLQFFDSLINNFDSAGIEPDLSKWRLAPLTTQPPCNLSYPLGDICSIVKFKIFSSHSEYGWHVIKPCDPVVNKAIWLKIVINNKSVVIDTTYIFIWPQGFINCIKNFLNSSKPAGEIFEWSNTIPKEKVQVLQFGA